LQFDWLQTHYVLLLCSFKEQLQQHVRVHALEAVMGCWELEQSLQSLTGGSFSLPAFINSERQLKFSVMHYLLLLFQ